MSATGEGAPGESPRVVVIIPAFNEADSIGRVVAAVRAAVPDADVCVINDGSADATGRLARAAGAVTVDLPFNMGIGAAVQTGFMYANQRAYDVAVRIDGDGQHPPATIQTLLDALHQTGADMVIGSRFLVAARNGYRGTLPRRVGIRLLSGVIHLLTNERVSDPTSGFLAANRAAITFCAQDYPYDYPEPEMRVLMHRGGLHVVEVPAQMQNRLGGVSSITTTRSVYYMSKVLLSLALGAIRRPRRAK